MSAQPHAHSLVVSTCQVTKWTELVVMMRLPARWWYLLEMDRIGCDDAFAPCTLSGPLPRTNAWKWCCNMLQG